MKIYIHLWKLLLLKELAMLVKKLHTGRSRNDQVALDMRLYTRDEVLKVDEEVKELMIVILQYYEGKS